MRTTFLRNRAFLLAGAAALAAAGAAAQTADGPKGREQHHTNQQQTAAKQSGPWYDRSGEMTFGGAVQNVRQQASEKTGRGTHVTVRAEDGRIHNVYLGPREYLDQHNLRLRSGDRVQITGSRATVNGRTVLVAREVQKEDRRVTLRTPEGTPQWQTAQADRTEAEDVYDRAAESTIRGTVGQVKVFSRPGMGARQHAVVQTDDGQRISVQLGPPDWMNRQQYQVKRGDRIEATGARVKFGSDESLLAREIRIGDRTYALRGAEGQPQWMTGAGTADRTAGDAGTAHDAQQATSVEGTVEDVSVHDRPGSTHATIRTGDGRTVTVVMGPAGYLEQQGIELRQGDQVQVSGSRMSVEGQDAIVAREVRKGDRTVTLRDQSGQPRWQEQGGQQQQQP